MHGKILGVMEMDFLLHIIVILKVIDISDAFFHCRKSRDIERDTIK